MDVRALKYFPFELKRLDVVTESFNLFNSANVSNAISSYEINSCNRRRLMLFLQFSFLADFCQLLI
jgi:hypothetical protein